MSLTWGRNVTTNGKTSIWEALVEFFAMNPIVNTIITSLTLIWPLFALNIYGKDLGFTATSSDITQRGQISTIVIYGLILLSIFCANFYIYRMAKAKQNNVLIEKTLNVVRQLYEEKLDRLSDSFLNSVNEGKKLQIDYNIKKRIDTILCKLVESFNEIVDGINTEDVSASLFYTFMGDQENWQRCSCNYVSASPEFDETKANNDVMTNPKSFGYHILNGSGKYSFVFLNDKDRDGLQHKEAGVIKQIYRKNSRDGVAYERTKNMVQSLA